MQQMNNQLKQQSRRITMLHNMGLFHHLTSSKQLE